MAKTSQTPSPHIGTKDRKPPASPGDTQAAAIRSSHLPQGFRSEQGRKAGRSERQHSKAMAPQDIAEVSTLASSLGTPGVLDTLAHLERGVMGARSSLIAATILPTGSFLRRCAAWLGQGVGLFSAPIQRAQSHVAETLKQLRDFSDVKVKPITDEVCKKYRGRTFERTPETQRALVLASVPTALKHLNHDFDNLKKQVREMVKESGGALKLIKGLGDERIAISRKGQYGNDETLEFAFRREGKVTVFLNGKAVDVVVDGKKRPASMWNGLAIDTAKDFAAGRNLSFETTRFKHYTVKEPSVASTTGKADSKGASSGDGAEQVTKQSFQSLQRTVAQFVDPENERGIRFFHDGPTEGRFSLIRKSESGKSQLLQVVSKEGDRSQILINGEVLGTVSNQAVMKTVAAFVNGNEARQRQTASV